MRGEDVAQGTLFSYVSLEEWIPKDHLLSQDAAMGVRNTGLVIGRVHSIIFVHRAPVGGTGKRLQALALYDSQRAAVGLAIRL
jgi:hypothetical protein